MNTNKLQQFLENVENFLDVGFFCALNSLINAGTVSVYNLSMYINKWRALIINNWNFQWPKKNTNQPTLRVSGLDDEADDDKKFTPFIELCLKQAKQGPYTH